MIYNLDGNYLKLNFDLPAGDSQTIQCLINCTEGKELSAETNSRYKIEARVHNTGVYKDLMVESIDLGAVAATQPEQTPNNNYSAALFSDLLYLIEFDLKITALNSAFTAENLVLIIN